MSLLLPLPSLALDPARHVSQYGHSSWRVQDGHFPNVPQSITQTADGYIWIGTGSGLVRFDGVRFVPWRPPSGETPVDFKVLSMLGTRDGSLWIGTGSELAQLKDGQLVTYRGNGGRVNAIREDRHGAIWFVRSRSRDNAGPLCRVTGTVTKCFGTADGIPFRWAHTLVSDGIDGFWIGSLQGLCHWTPGRVTNFLPDRLKDASGATGVNSFSLMPDGTALVGLGQGGSGFGLQQLSGDTWRDFLIPGGIGSSLWVETHLVDRDGAIWLSTQEGGLFHGSAARTDRFRQSDGLSGDTVIGIFEDREGNIWTVAPEGIDQFRNLPVGTLSRREGLTANDFGAVATSNRGNVWIGGMTTVSRFFGGKLSSITAKDGLPGKRVTALLEDHAGRLWIGADAGMSILESGRFRSISRARDGTPLRMVVALAEDSGQNVWALVVGPSRHILCLRDFKISEEIPVSDNVAGGAFHPDPTGGIWVGHTSGRLTRYRAGMSPVVVPADGSGPVRNLSIDPDGTTWAASSLGLIRRSGASSNTLDQRNGLLCNDLFATLRDDTGALWIYAACGLMRISATELHRWSKDPSARVEVSLLDRFDGTHPATGTFGPVAARSIDGRLWFSNDSLIEFVDPRNLVSNNLAPPVRIEQIVADRVTLPPHENLRLPPLTRHLQIDYTALSFSVPQKVKFKFRLDGHDDEWQEAETRRQAFYTDLAPGSYRFRVIACNNDGVWNEAGASLAFVVLPAYYQTLWFTLLGITFALLTFWGAYRMRVQQVTAAMGARFDERIEERNRLSGELHDTILQSVQISKMIADHALSDKSGHNVEALRTAITTLSGWLAQATADGRTALNALRSSTATTSQDLSEAFRQSAETSLIHHPIEFVVSVEGPVQILHPIVRDEVYRIGSEAIRNSCLHSNATRISVKLIFARDLTVQVKDDGQGIDPAVLSAGKPGHFGLAGMQERSLRIGAHFRLLSRIGDGTLVELTVPGKIAFYRSRRPTFLGTIRRFWRSSETDVA